MKYSIEINGKLFQSGYFLNDNDYNAINNRVDFLKSVVKDDVSVVFKTWSPNR